MADEEYKLYYFNRRVLGETIRFILHYANVPFEDIRVEFDEWPKLKPSLGWEKMPVLKSKTVELTQSAAIGRYLARKYGLTGRDELESALCDEYIDCAKDFRQQWRLFWFETDETKKAAAKKHFVDEVMPFYFTKYNEIVVKNGGNWLVSHKETWADFWLVIFIDLFELTISSDILESYPGLQSLKNNVLSIPQIKSWVEKRPKTIY